MMQLEKNNPGFITNAMVGRGVAQGLRFKYKVSRSKTQYQQGPSAFIQELYQ